MRSNSFVSVLKWAAYGLSIVILALGLIAGFSLLSSSSAVQNVLTPFQAIGGGAIVNLITPYLRGLLSSLGVMTLVVSLALSLVLFAVGRLLGRNAGLEARLARLEAIVLDPSPAPAD